MSRSHQTRGRSPTFDLLGNYILGFTVAGITATGACALWTYLARSH